MKDVRLKRRVLEELLFIRHFGKGKTVKTKQTSGCQQPEVEKG